MNSKDGKPIDIEDQSGSAGGDPGSGYPTGLELSRRWLAQEILLICKIPLFSDYEKVNEIADVLRRESIPAAQPQNPEAPSPAVRERNAEGEAFPYLAKNLPLLLAAIPIAGEQPIICECCLGDIGAQHSE